MIHALKALKTMDLVSYFPFCSCATQGARSNFCPCKSKGSKGSKRWPTVPRKQEEAYGPKEVRDKIHFENKECHDGIQEDFKNNEQKK
jgi:hypothetical protein